MFGAYKYWLDLWASILVCCYLGRMYLVLPPSIRVLPILITPRFVHKKFIQKYEWIEHISIYHHAKFEVEQKFVQEGTKKRNLHLNSCGFDRSFQTHNPLLFIG